MTRQSGGADPDDPEPDEWEDVLYAEPDDPEPDPEAEPEPQPALPNYFFETEDAATNDDAVYDNWGQGEQEPNGHVVICDLANLFSRWELYIGRDTSKILSFQRAGSKMNPITVSGRDVRKNLPTPARPAQYCTDHYLGSPVDAAARCLPARNDRCVICGNNGEATLEPVRWMTLSNATSRSDMRSALTHIYEEQGLTESLAKWKQTNHMNWLDAGKLRGKLKEIQKDLKKKYFWNNLPRLCERMVSEVSGSNDNPVSIFFITPTDNGNPSSPFAGTGGTGAPSFKGAWPEAQRAIRTLHKSRPHGLREITFYWPGDLFRVNDMTTHLLQDGAAAVGKRGSIFEQFYRNVSGANPMPDPAAVDEVKQHLQTHNRDRNMIHSCKSNDDILACCLAARCYELGRSVTLLTNDRLQAETTLFDAIYRYHPDNIRYHKQHQQGDITKDQYDVFMKGIRITYADIKDICGGSAGAYGNPAEAPRTGGVDENGDELTFEDGGAWPYLLNVDASENRGSRCVLNRTFLVNSGRLEPIWKEFDPAFSFPLLTLVLVPNETGGCPRIDGHAFIDDFPPYTPPAPLSTSTRDSGVPDTPVIQSQTDSIETLKKFIPESHPWMKDSPIECGALLGEAVASVLYRYNMYDYIFETLALDGPPRGHADWYVEEGRGRKQWEMQMNVAILQFLKQSPALVHQYRALTDAIAKPCIELIRGGKDCIGQTVKSTCLNSAGANDATCTADLTGTGCTEAGDGSVCTYTEPCEELGGCKWDELHGCKWDSAKAKETCMPPVS